MDVSIVVIDDVKREALTAPLGSAEQRRPRICAPAVTAAERLPATGAGGAGAMRNRVGDPPEYPLP